jgi:CRP-like cAMP-binding protein
MAHPLSDPSEGGAAARLGALAPLGPEERYALSQAQELKHQVAAHHIIVEDGCPVTSPSIILSGWACRTRIFLDGRRQILSLLVPGDLIGVCRQNRPIAATGAVALTDVILCPAPTPERAKTGLAEAYARSGALEEFYLFRQIARLGRMSAYERIADLLLEIGERLSAVLRTPHDRFPFPLTQETLADLLGLTSVHVNRMLQLFRRQGLLDVRGGTVHIRDLARLIDLVEHRRAEVSGA